MQLFRQSIVRNSTVFYAKKGQGVPFIHNLTRLLPADIIVNVATPIQAEKGGLTYGRHTYCFFCLGCGKYSLPLYLQMVGQRQFRQPAQGLSHPCHKTEQKTPVAGTTGVFVALTDYLLLFAYWHYSICSHSFQVFRFLELFPFRTQFKNCSPELSDNFHHGTCLILSHFVESAMLQFTFDIVKICTIVKIITIADAL